MLTTYEFEEYIRKSMQEEYYFSSAEKMQMIGHIDFYNKQNPNTFERERGAIFQLIAFGPVCWNGGAHHIKYKRQGGKKCWYCDYYHEDTI